MVSNAKDDFPEPERPVNTIIEFLGNFRSTFLRLWVFAPLICMWSSMKFLFHPERSRRVANTETAPPAAPRGKYGQYSKVPVHCTMEYNQTGEPLCRISAL